MIEAATISNEPIARSNPPPRLTMTSLNSCIITDEEVEELLSTYHIIDRETIGYGSINNGAVSNEMDLYTKSSSLVAFFHIVCVMAGTGILQLPYALKTGGWFALLWIFISGFLAYQGGKLTVACLYYDGLNRLNGIIEIGEAAYGKNGKRLVEICFSSLTVGACGLYLILASNNLELVDKWTGLTKHEWIIICTILSCVPFVSIKTLKEAAMLSVFGVITTIVMVVVVLNVAYVDYNHLENSGNTIIEAYGNVANYPTYSWISLKYLPLSLASISFSFGGNSVFSHVEHSMQNPKSFNNVLKWALLFVCFLYSSVAFIGYLAYGNNTVSPIFNNLQPGLAVTVAIIMLTAHVLLAIPINLTSFSIEAEHSLGLTSSNVSPGRQAVYRVAFRMLISIFTCSFAILLPYFDHVMALLGALSNGIIVFIFPPLFYVKLYGWRSCSLYMKLICSAIFITGIFVVITGTVQSLIALEKDIFHR